MMNTGPLAPWYRLIEYCAFGHALERRRFAFSRDLHQARSILILGEGDGRMLAKLLSGAPEASFDVVETSAQMIALARRRVGNEASLVRFLQQDARTLEVDPASYDALVTCFFLDCFAEPEARTLIAKLARALKPGGLWLVSDFAVPPNGWRRWHAILWIRAMYGFFRIATGLRVSTVPPIERLLHEAGLALTAREEERAGLMFSALWRKPD